MNIRKTTLLFLLTATFGFPASHKVSRDLTAVPPDQQVSVIVRYTHRPEAADHAKITQAGGKLKRTLDLVNSAVYTLPASALADLENDPDVEYVTPDRRVAATLDYANPASNASIARQYGWNGTGVTVAVIDSGIMDSHPDLQTPAGASRVVYAESFNLAEGNDVYDRYGHGTHVASTIASPINGLGIAGVAPKVTLVNLRAGQDSGYFLLAPTLAALTYAGDIGVDVVNMSFYTDPWLFNCTKNPADSPAEQAEQSVIREATQRAINYARGHGVLPIAAMGNEATDLNSPTVDPTSPDFPPGIEKTRTIDNSCRGCPGSRGT